MSAGSVWKYLDNGSNQGTAWRASAFDDSAWASGAAELGYGDGGEGTVVSFGPDSNNKYITTYFRKSFSVTNPAIFAGATLRVRRDDGIVVYLNGVEVFRDTMPTGSPTYTTLATAAVADDGATWLSASIPPSALVAGTNVFAVEIHQSAVTSSDISFDLELTASTTASITRAPYLQIGTPSSITVRWRTDAATNSRVSYGLSAASLSSVVDDAVLTTEHIVTLTGLSPDTKYYYSVGSTTATLAGGDANHFFVTSPPSGGQRPTRIWVIGDAGTGTASQAAVRDAYYTFTGSTHTDLWLQLGDNAYNSGTDAEYQANMFNVYATLLRKSVTWPTLGNHETNQSTTPPASLPYFQMFSFPTTGQAGGVASGTKNYYSFDFGNIHFVCLDSMASSRAPGSAMLTWLQNDLAANSKDWLVAFWHHPPYTKGSHNSDTETPLIEMRQNVLPILENYGVDLVLSGHSHSYERSYFIDGHYGLSTTFTESMKKNSGGGSLTGTGAYTKTVLGPSAHQGAVYAVAGSSGQTSGGTLNHPAMYISLNSLGSMVLDVNGGQMDVRFLNSTGGVADNFTMIKGSNNTPPSVSLTAPAPGTTVAAPASINLAATATDTNGTIARVEFYQNNTLLFTDTTAPYEYSWTNVPAGSYSLTAKAFDNDGASTTSTAVAIIVNALPTVSLTSPAASDPFTAPASVTLAATAADTDGTIQRVEFYQGATLLGSDTSSPFSVSWTNVAAGTYTLTAKAYDDRNAVTTSTSVVITVNAPPTVSLTSPAPNTTVAAPATINLAATAADTDGTVQRVEFYQGATLLGSDTAAPFEFSWANVPSGTYTLTAKAYDDRNAVTTSAAVAITVNTLPTVSLTSPTNGASFTAPATINLAATATDTDGTIQRVEFYQGATLLNSDTAAPYAFSWTGVGSGTYTLTAKAYDDRNAVTTSTSVVITVNAPPSVSLTSPTSGASFTAPATISIAATAADTDGTVQRVDFYQGATLLGSDSTAPYAYSWTGVPAGSYTITAVAVDNNNASTTSTAVAVSVVNPTSDTILLPKHSIWRYLDTGVNLGTAWRASNYSDSTWKTGAAELGYGDGGEATVVSFGPKASQKYITTYFRTTFNVANPALFQTLVFNLLRDDGAVVYLNGVEIFRSNMPATTISSTTLASTDVTGANETTYFASTTAAAGKIVTGTNVLAVEIHQVARNNADLSFDLEVLGRP